MVKFYSFTYAGEEDYHREYNTLGILGDIKVSFIIYLYHYIIIYAYVVLRFLASPFCSRKCSPTVFSMKETTLTLPGPPFPSSSLFLAFSEFHRFRRRYSSEHWVWPFMISTFVNGRPIFELAPKFARGDFIRIAQYLGKVLSLYD